MRALKNVINPHILAMASAFIYAWVISGSSYVTTGIQFVAPLLVLMGVHLIYLILQGNLSIGFASTIWRRSLHSAIGMAVIVLLICVIVPTQGHADVAGTLASFAMFAICMLMIALVIIFAGFLIYSIMQSISYLLGKLGKTKSDDTDSRLFDFGSLVIVFTAVTFASLEGLPIAYSFSTKSSGSASYLIDASPKQVWQALETATSPAFPLPQLLNVFPRPTEVTVDEGTALGAMRKVKFEGREGQGFLSLQVLERTPESAVFVVLSDTSPVAQWVSHQRLIYNVTPVDSNTRLTVSLEYERGLAPAWFFGPAVNQVAKMAMGVLARDVKERAES